MTDDWDALENSHMTDLARCELATIYINEAADLQAKVLCKEVTPKIVFYMSYSQEAICPIPIATLREMIASLYAIRSATLEDATEDERQRVWYQEDMLWSRWLGRAISLLDDQMVVEKLRAESDI